MKPPEESQRQKDDTAELAGAESPAGRALSDATWRIGYAKQGSGW